MARSPVESRGNARARRRGAVFLRLPEKQFFQEAIGANGGAFADCEGRYSRARHEIGDPGSYEDLACASIAHYECRGVVSGPSDALPTDWEPSDQGKWSFPRRGVL